MPDKAGGVDRGRRPVKRGEIIGEARIAVIALLADQIERRRRARRRGQRREADAAIAGNHGRDALAGLRRHVRRREQRPVVMRMHVDKAGRDDLSGHVDLARPGHLGRHRPDRRTIRSPSIATSPRKRGLPVPSITVPPRRIKSAIRASELSTASLPPAAGGRRCGSIGFRGRSVSLRIGRLSPQLLVEFTARTELARKDQREPTCRSSIATAHTGPDAIQSRRPTGIASRYRPHIRSCNRRLSLRRRAVRV